MSIRNEKVRSLIICKDKDFKRRSMNILIEVALPAEKFHTEKIFDAKSKFMQDKQIGVIIINASDDTVLSFCAWMDELAPVINPRKPKVIVYYSKEQKEELQEKMKNYPLCTFFEHPVKKADFNHVINPIQGETPKGKERKPELNKNFVEASAHVKVTIDLLNELIKDRKNLEAVRHTGQRFNGLFGTFAFGKDSSGYKELYVLSQIVDDVCRHYEGDEHSEISEEHFNLLVSAAKCTYYMLKELRENRPLNESHVEVFDKVVATFEKHPEIKRRDSKSQDEVDDLLKELGA